MNNPIDLFHEWHREATSASAATCPNAVCVSTVDAAGAPHGRFVDLKAIGPDGFVFCTSYASPKGLHIEANPAVSLSFWWDHVGRQVRVLGSAVRISAAEADTYFADRSRDAQLASWAFDQSAQFESDQDRELRLAAVRQQFGDGAIPRPPDWGGYRIAPHRVEFLRFCPSRAHERLLFQLDGSDWIVSELQP